MKRLQTVLAILIIALAVSSVKAETKVLASSAHWRFTAVIESDTTFQLIETKRNQIDNVVLIMDRQELIETLTQSLSIETFADEGVIEHQRAKKMRQAFKAFEANQLPSGGFDHGVSTSGEAVVGGFVIATVGTGVAIVVAAPAVAVVAGVWGFVHVITHI